MKNSLIASLMIISSFAFAEEGYQDEPSQEIVVDDQCGECSKKLPTEIGMSCCPDAHQQ